MGALTAGVLHAWRHPRVAGAQGLCVGRTDLGVDARRAKRQAHRLRAFARRHGLPRIVVTSALRRSRDVGRWLARWGWRHHIDAALAELDFGHWDGRPWSAVPREEFDAWCADFAQAAPGGGETVAALLRRVRGFDPGDARLVVTHGGWLSAALWLRDHGGAPPSSAQWPAAPRHGQRVELPLAGDTR
ncbi:histidine phosphatase family protein [Piscinibacter sp.]|uniref:histidine phosphatase family protein n=1 Tax=Piscinibacter sp. TaxID=1903157 RepID=UPI0039E57A62